MWYDTPDLELVISRMDYWELRETLKFCIMPPRIAQLIAKEFVNRKEIQDVKKNRNI